MTVTKEEMDDLRNLALEEAALIADHQQIVFRSDEYAVGQPASSWAERFACKLVAEKIRKLKVEG
jgi:hypothetical protein